MKERAKSGVIVVLVLLALMVSESSAGDDFDGSGTAGDPYQIGTLDRLQFLSQNTGYWGAGVYFKLMDDITILPGEILNPIGNNSAPFGGVFDGKGHVITELVQSGIEYLGLFGQTASSATIRNTSVVEATITGSGDYLGILVGNNYGNIRNCHVSGVVTGRNNLGGLVGNNHGDIRYCHASGVVTGVDNLGGLMGENNHYVIYNSASGAVKGTENLGGLVGYNLGTIFLCHANTNVTGGDRSKNAGGLVGLNKLSVKYSYATGAVRGDTGAYGGLGGLVGWSGQDAPIRDCYATGKVSGQPGVLRLGGLVGIFSGLGRDISRCYWDIDTSGMTDGVSAVDDPIGVMGRTTIQMKQQATFSRWDFADIWLIVEDQSYPYHDLPIGPTPPIPGDLNGDGMVNLLDWAIFSQHWLEGNN